MIAYHCEQTKSLHRVPTVWLACEMLRPEVNECAVVQTWCLERLRRPG